MSHYGRFVGERGTHTLTGGKVLLEVVSLSILNNDNAVYRIVGDDDAEEFMATAEHFDPVDAM